MEVKPEIHELFFPDSRNGDELGGDFEGELSLPGELASLSVLVRLWRCGRWKGRELACEAPLAASLSDWDVVLDLVPVDVRGDGGGSAPALAGLVLTALDFEGGV